jgi:hypothetical protein
MTPTVKYGTIVSYAGMKTFGYIRPDIARGDHKEVSFLTRCSRLPYERTVGDIVLREEDFGTSSEGYLYLKKHETFIGDRVVYFEEETHQGPRAHRWTLAREWDRSVKTLDSRPDPAQPLARVYRLAEDHYSKIVVWEGFFDRLAEAVRVGEPFLQLEGLHFEWRLVHGWKPLVDVRKDYFPTHIPLSAEGKIRSMRMYLALLIERGLSIFNREEGTRLLWYAAIGRTRRPYGAHNLWGLEDRLPSGNPDILRTCYGVGLITNLDPLFLRLLGGYGYGPDRGDERDHAKRMVRDLRSDKSVGISSPSQVREEEAKMEHYIGMVEQMKNKARTSTTSL